MYLSTYMSYAYLDMRIRFYTNNKMHDVHLLNYPIFEKYTKRSFIYVNVTSIRRYVKTGNIKLYLLLNYLYIIIQYVSSILVRKLFVFYRIQRASLPGLVRVGYGAHQLDLAIQMFYTNSMSMIFLLTLIKLIGFLRRQFNLITKMRYKWP